MAWQAVSGQPGAVKVRFALRIVAWLSSLRPDGLKQVPALPITPMKLAVHAWHVRVAWAG
ncbi:MAG TPA: hypothetical protein VN043_15325 [Rhodanobacter sp.]|nr:hypothetical protein [Rhodanobacter sp.]